jgi:hypothetical protein
MSLLVTSDVQYVLGAESPGLKMKEAVQTAVVLCRSFFDLKEEEGALCHPGCRPMALFIFLIKMESCTGREAKSIDLRC